MKPHRLEALERLEQAEWFVNVGRADSTGALVLHSWEEALASCSGDQWQWVHQEAANDFTAGLAKRDKNRFNQWNDVVAEVRKVIVPLVTRKTENVVTANDLPHKFCNSVRWDILHLCMEAEYSDLSPPGFFSALTRWYVEGHFPCGWEGDYPQGRLVIC